MATMSTGVKLVDGVRTSYAKYAERVWWHSGNACDLQTVLAFGGEGGMY